ncbi:hypothetical protein M514_09239 [Trichuris suis]|uniref:Gamma-tubulin complex component n=1 Tax=Trichuris suis TaxID=68888 RepID=A0A085NLD4_9BILA|nr:hypothetical protein M514_09239 [Trichuris suis]
MAFLGALEEQRGPWVLTLKPVKSTHALTLLQSLVIHHLCEDALLLVRLRLPRKRSSDSMDVLQPVYVFQESIIDALQQLASTVVGQRNFNRAHCFRCFKVFLSRRAAKVANQRKNYAAEVQKLLAKRKIVGNNGLHKKGNVASLEQLIDQLQPFKEGNEELNKILFFLLLLEGKPQSSPTDTSTLYDFQNCLNAPSPPTALFESYSFSAYLHKEDTIDTNLHNEEPLCLLSTNAQRHMQYALSLYRSQATTKGEEILDCYKIDLTAAMLNNLYLQASCQAYLKNKGPFPKSTVYISFSQLKEFVRRLFSGISSDMFVYNEADNRFIIGVDVSLDGIMLDAFKSSVGTLLQAGANSRRIRQFVSEQKPTLCHTIEMFRSALLETYCEHLKTTLTIIERENSIVSLLINLQPSIRWLKLVPTFMTIFLDQYFSFFGTIVSGLRRHLRQTNGKANVCWLWNVLYNSSYLCNSTDSFLNNSIFYCICYALTPFLGTLEIALNEYKWYDPYQEFRWIQCAYLTGSSKEDADETLEDLCYLPPEDMPLFIGPRVATVMSCLRYCFVLEKCTKFSQAIKFKFTWEPKRLSKEGYSFAKLIGQEETEVMTPISVPVAEALEKFFDETFSKEKFEFVHSSLWQYYVNRLDVLGVLTDCNRIFFGGDTTSTIWPIFGESLFPTIIDRLEPSRIANHPLMWHAARQLCQKGRRLKMSFALDNSPPKFDLQSDQLFSWIKPRVELSWPLSLVLPERSVKIYEQIWRILSYANFSVWYARTMCNDLQRSQRSTDHQANVRCCVDLHNVHKFANDLNSFIAEEITIACAKFAEDIKAVESIDWLRRTHSNFLNAIQRRCLFHLPNIHFCFMEIFKSTIACCESVRCGDLQAAAEYSSSTVQRACDLCIIKINLTKKRSFPYLLRAVENRVLPSYIPHEVSCFVADVNGIAHVRVIEAGDEA